MSASTTAATVPETAPTLETTTIQAPEVSSPEQSEKPAATETTPTEAPAVAEKPAETPAPADIADAPEVVPPPAPQKNVVIVGGSYAGVSAAHYFLRHVLPKLPNPDTYHVTLVSASSRFYARPATPRAVASYTKLPVEKVFYDIAAGFEKYPAEQFTFVHGAATNLNEQTKTIEITDLHEQSRNIQYDGLVIATGTRTATSLLGLQKDYKETEDAQRAFQAALPNAKTIIIAGGGPAAVEVAGELAELRNGAPGMFKKVNKQVEITIITSDSRLLPGLAQTRGQKAEDRLRKLGVEVLYNRRVESVVPETAGTTNIAEAAQILQSNGETLGADLYIPATGVKPNTGFLPTKWLTEKSFVHANEKTLRVDEAGTGVYAVGDVSSAATWGIMDIYSSIPIVMSNLRKDLILAANSELKASADREWKANKKETQLVCIGSKGGVGAMFGTGLPAFMVGMIKGKDYFASRAPAIVDGSHWKTEKAWSGEQVTV